MMRSFVIVALLAMGSAASPGSLRAEGSCPQALCPEASCPQASCPEGPCPEGPCSEGSCPEASNPEGPCPVNCCCEPCPPNRDTCHADLTGDEEVGMADLLAVLGDWDAPENNCWALARVEGNWGGCPVRGDVTGDGCFNSNDLHALVAALRSGIDCRVDLDRNKRVDEDDRDTWHCLRDLGDLETADLNCDGLLDQSDLDLVEQAISEQRDCRADLNGDGEIGWSDIVIVADEIER